MKYSPALLLLVLLVSQPARKQVTFTGHVDYGDGFSKILPNGLVFELTPSDCGWTVTIHPSSSDNEDYVWPENPPIHAKNVLFLDDEYDGDWESPLKQTHTIYFARNERQARAELAWADAFEHGEYKKSEKFDIPQSQLGELQLSITSYGKQVVQDKGMENRKDNYCATDVKFHVLISRD